MSVVLWEIMGGTEYRVAHDSSEEIARTLRAATAMGDAIRQVVACGSYDVTPEGSGHFVTVSVRAGRNGRTEGSVVRAPKPGSVYGPSVQSLDGAILIAMRTGATHPDGSFVLGGVLCDDHHPLSIELAGV